MTAQLRIRAKRSRIGGFNFGRFLASPLGRAAVISVLSLAALTSASFSHRAVAAPLVYASPAAITGELA